MMMVRLNIFVFCSLILFGLYNTQDKYSDKVSNYVYLLDLYKSGNYSVVDLIPLENASNPMVITAEVELYSLNDFDEVSGQIELATSVTFVWLDEIVQAVTGLSNAAVFTITSPDDSLLVPYNKIWTPKIVLDNSISSQASIGGNEYMCRYTLISGNVTWSPKILIKSACSPDVTYYPFDRQTCKFAFVTWKFTASEILFQVSRSDWILSSFEENGEWDVVETSTKDEIFNDQSYLRLTIKIERKPLYFAFNIILPVISLSFLNLMVFWLPSESGERVGFAVTCFLSFVVLLNTIMEILPRTSSPMSYLCYYVVVMMLFSGLVTTLTVIQVRIFHKYGDAKVPRLMQTLVRCFKCNKHKTNSDKAKVVPDSMLTLNDKEIADETREWSTPVPPSSTPQTDTESGEEDKPDVTWADVSRVLDLVFFLGFLGAQAFFSVTFLLPVAFRV